MRLLPREEKFYHLFLKQVEIISEASRLLLEGVTEVYVSFVVVGDLLDLLLSRSDSAVSKPYVRAGTGGQNRGRVIYHGA